MCTLEQSISLLNNKIHQLSQTNRKKDTIISDLKSYIDYIHGKYSKILESEKTQYLTLQSLINNRHNSTDSLNSLNSMFSQRSYPYDSNQSGLLGDEDNKTPKKRSSWLRSSFSRAFSRKLNNKQNSPKSINNESPGLDNSKNILSDVDENETDSIHSNSLARKSLNKSHDINYDMISLPTSPIHNQYHNQQNKNMDEYERLLREKEIKLTDIRLEALATAHQLDQTKEENVKIKIELEQLKCENVRMQQILNSLQHNNNNNFNNSNHLISSPSPSSSISSNNSKSMNQVDFSTTSSSSLIINNKPDSGKRVLVSIFNGDSNQNPLEVPIENQNIHTIIGSININTRTNWECLDQIVKSLFKDYLDKLDQCDETSKLGLGSESIHLYYVGDMVRYSDLIDEDKLPDLLPYGYLVGDFTNIIIKLKDSFQNSIDSLCYDTLVPKNVLQRYISLLLDYKNLLFCGPNGTNKSYIARKIAEHLVKRQNKDLETSIAYFDVENRSCYDLKQYLNNLIIDSDVSYDLNSSSSLTPSVLVLDNLQHCTNMTDTFSEYFNKNSSKKWYVLFHYYNILNLIT